MDCKSDLNDFLNFDDENQRFAITRPYTRQKSLLVGQKNTWLLMDGQTNGRKHTPSRRNTWLRLKTLPHFHGLDGILPSPNLSPQATV